MPRSSTLADLVARPRVTDKDARALIAASPAHPAATDRAAWRKLFEANVDRFDPTAQRRLDRYLGAGRMPLADPAIVSGDRQHPAYARAYGRLFVNGVGPRDVMQGALGDCSFVSSMIAVARTHPELIERALRANP